MDNRVIELLDEAIVRKVERLNDDIYENSDKDCSDQIEEINTLHKMRIEEAKIEVAKREAAIKMAEQKTQAKNQKHDRLVNVALNAGLTIGSWIMFTAWHRSEQKFELTGTPTTPIFRGLLSKMIPSIKR